VIRVAEKQCVSSGLRTDFLNIIYKEMTASVVWWSETLATDPQVRVRFLGRYQIFGVVVRLERGPLSLVSTTRSYFEEIVAPPV
jgi:hypothetical protein